MSVLSRNWLADAFIDRAAGIIVTAIVLTPLGYFSARYQMLRSSYRLWRVRNRRKVTVVIARGEKQTGEYLQPVTGAGQVVASSVLLPTLTRAYGISTTETICFPDEVDQIDTARDLVILGGPKNNYISAEFFKLLENMPVTMQVYEEDGTLKTRIVWMENHPNGTVVCYEFPDNNDTSIDLINTENKTQPTIDYGVIIRCESPFLERDSSSTLKKKSATVTVFAGLHTFGTGFAAQYFIENKKMFLKRRRRNYACVVRFETFDRRNIFRSKCVKSFNLNRKRSHSSGNL
jgi:hypothetical protein